MTDTTVLLVDDEDEFVSVLAERLEARNLEVHTAADGEGALAMAKTRAFDAVLLDMAMPGLNGVETLRALLEIDRNQQVILVTGRATLAQAVEAMKLGALDLLEKPADINMLVARIAEAAKRRSSLDDKRVQQKMSDIIRKKGW